MGFFEIYLFVIFTLTIIFLVYFFSGIKVSKKNEVEIYEKTKTDFVSSAVHQLKMPLSTIKLSLEMLLDGSFGKINKEQKDIIEKTYQRNKTLIYLVNDLLDIAKIEEKEYCYDLEPIDVEDLIKFVISSNQEEIERKKIELKFETPKIKFPKIILDKEKMLSAIKNIFDNAVKYTPAGGRITIFFKVSEKELEFKIEDSGIGIPEYQKKKLFAKFFRASNAIKMEPMGSGLGLFIAKNIIEKHHGKIWFESKENEGSSFFFSIPIKREVDPAPLSKEN